MKYLALLYSLSIIVSCKPTTNVENATIKKPGPHFYIYKTNKDYFNNVPILLSDNKLEIISYPDPSDLVMDGKLCLPTKLVNGYLLDNRGIGLNVAFIEKTYSEYSQLKSLPKLAELKQMIVDSDPLIEFYDCGLRSKYKNPELELNEIINNGKINNFKKLK